MDVFWRKSKGAEAMKHRRFLIFLLMAVCLFGSMEAKAVDSVKVTEFFDDVPENAWYVGAVQYVYDHDIMKGMGDSATDPEKKTFGSLKWITRGEFATVLYSLEGKPQVHGDTVFPDVPAGAYYVKPIQWLYENGIAKGNGNGTFAPNDPITREQLARMLSAYAQLKHYDTNASQLELDRFGDEEKISDWARSSLAWAVKVGVMCGSAHEVPLLNPKGNATRAECAAMMKKLCENILSDIPVEITATQWDITPVPDKYSVGAKGTLEKIEMNGKVSGIQLIKGATAAVFKFATVNKEISGRIVIENCDFSEFDVNTYEESETDRDITIVFRNCRFGNVYKGLQDSRVFYEFENCSLVRFQGSNASFLNCAIGGSYQDGMNPYRHVKVVNCYFSDFSHMHEGGEYHTDGIHVFGKANVDVVDITFERCRFEVPFNNPDGSDAIINSCIMLVPEYSNASDVTVRDCIVNGGGYTIYAYVKDGYDFTLSNVLFENIRVGGAAVFGPLYPTVSSEVKFNNMTDTDSLYVGTVWKEDGATHFSVTNDTISQRKLKIITDAGSYTETIAPCPGGRRLLSETGMLEFPTDIDICIPEDCAYAVCLDVTDAENVKQIRFVNYGEQPVYVLHSELK